MTRSFGRSRPQRPARPARRLGLVAVLAVVALTATGCDEPRFGFPPGATIQANRILNIWEGSFIAALIVGILVWGMIFYAAIAFRKRTDEMPAQIRYNLPVEVLYTILPIVVIAGLFYYTARDEIEINKVSKNPAVTVDVVGFRWNWQFVYSDTGKDGTQPVQVTGRVGQPAVLVLPEGRKVRFVLTSPDVIHSFWVPDFLFKRDVIPGRINQFEVTIDKTGTFIGRCAEFCGTDHDRMNFYVKVVPGPEYDRYLAQRSNTRVLAAPATTTNGSGQ